MSKMGFKRPERVLHRWCEEIHAKQPNELVIIYFDGPWVLEITPIGVINPPVNALTDWKLLLLRIRDLVSWLLKQEGFDGLGGAEDDFEWRLYRGSSGYATAEQ